MIAKPRIWSPVSPPSRKLRRQTQIISMFETPTRHIQMILIKGIEVHVTTIDIELVVNNSSLVRIPSAEVVPWILNCTSQVAREQ